jgi:DNA-directed RNA polymerase specialized sigma24 family protein
MAESKAAQSLLEALDCLEAVFDELAQQRRFVARRSALIRRRLAAGLPLSAIVQAEAAPLIVHTVRDVSTRLVDGFSKFQRAEALALYLEGMTMETIATLFGVSRQRIASLLREGGVDRSA